MLKIRIIALLTAIVFTLFLIYLIPIVVYWYKHFVVGLSHEQQQWFNYGQIALGALVALYGFSRWKKKKQ